MKLFMTTYIAEKCSSVNKWPDCKKGGDDLLWLPFIHLHQIFVVKIAQILFDLDKVLMLGYKKKIEVLNYKDKALTLNLPGSDG